jgi:uncharacterized membrane protein
MTLTTIELQALVQLIPVALFSWFAFWKNIHVLYMLTGGISFITGLAWYNYFTTNLGLAFSIVFIAYSLLCFGLAFRLMFGRRKGDEA